MKKYILSFAVILLAANAKSQGLWQSNTKYYPFVDGVASIQKDGHTAVAGEVGMLNKNTMLKAGVGTGSWEQSQAIIVVGAARRLFYVDRFETWLVAGTAFGITHKVDANIAPQIMENIQVDKCLSIFFTGGTHVNLIHSNKLAFQYGTGVRLTFGRGNVNNY